ncbi:(R)-mandelonitrile lyase [Membranihabitans maritimus]|uniref:(R)-mandelonitrile lyase n=1 Tax=Membranihabitans maritimus TaxID=2904244 RepID=UPI001F2AB5CB|nr:cupin domain-containing protein [Membranihabitans maritimus]
MELLNMRLNVLLVTFLTFGVFLACKAPEEESGRSTANAIFPKGSKGPSQFFTGTVWVTGLVDNDSIFTTSAGSVLFEPSARSNWHSHPAGQILIVTEGVGYHQIKGKRKEVIRKGDVVKCPPNTSHWHGASKDSSMTHIYLLPNTEKGMVKWMEPVSDQEFLNE